jgi:flagella basal body P-ring formation protein FlgA
MSLPVISLQAGVLGQKIRVTSLDHRQFYDAKIVAVGLLEGNL